MNHSTNVDKVGNIEFGAGGKGPKTRSLPADQCKDKCIDTGTLGPVVKLSVEMLCSLFFEAVIVS